MNDIYNFIIEMSLLSICIEMAMSQNPVLRLSIVYC